MFCPFIDATGRGAPLWCLLVATTLLCVWQLTCQRKRLFLRSLTETFSHLGMTTAQMSRPTGAVGKQTSYARTFSESSCAVI